MHVIRARNVHEMIPAVLRYMAKHGRLEESRNGPVARLREPCALVYERPDERVEFHPERDANPFFHLMEACWMLDGRRDVAFPARYVKTMTAFSDDGVTFNGAYGYRWRGHFGKDQLLMIVEALRKDPTCRRQVLAMWDGRHDLGLSSRDLPCNTQATFQIVDGALDMVVSNRSNDAVWGATGANAVHFSFLQEWMARAIGVRLGRYWQVSSNLHLYVERHQALMNRFAIDETPAPASQYVLQAVRQVPVMTIEPDRYLAELAMLLQQGPGFIGLRDPFLKGVVSPAMQSFEAYRSSDFARALSLARSIKDDAWAIACESWLNRRHARRIRANDDGVIYE